MVLAAGFSAITVPVPAMAGDFLNHQLRYPRVRAAHKHRQAAVRAEFRAAGAAWPPRGVFLRAFKAEDTLELWAAPKKSPGPYVHVRRFPICARSGELGPKRQQGDGQVPEGFYFVDRFNPSSRFHLSLGLNYPNAVDKKRASDARVRPGGDIFIHGSCVTIGCLPLTDGPMEDLYLALVYARDHGQTRIPVHVFPCRLNTEACRAKLRSEAESTPALADFWNALRPGYEAFQRTKRPPRIRAQSRGVYRLLRER